MSEKFSLGSLLRMAREAEPQPIPWEGPVQRPQGRPDGLFEKGFDIFSGALGIPGPQTRAYTLGELMAASVPMLGALKALKTTKAPIRAYHGSPHDFDKFSLEKIGTGEGAQAYGHGLYFAENPAVAREYRDSLAQTVKVGGKPVLENNRRVGTTGDADLDDMLVANHGDIDAVIRDLQQDVAANYPNAADRQRVAAQLAQAQRWKASGDVEAANTGKMYEVNIHADPEDFLDWDAPLSQQPQRARDVLSLPPQASRINESLITKGHPEMTGGNAYTEIRAAGLPGPELSERLKQQGIPGIKYYDQGSRGAKEGTRNYVVFDDKLISIVKKYGVVGALSAGLISQMQARQLQEQGY